MVVEDSPGDREAISRALDKLDSSVLVEYVDNGEDALISIFSGSYDLILLDLNIPLVSGLEVLRRCKSSSIKKHIPIIVLTSSEDPKSILEAYDSNCNMYLTKPDYGGYAGLATAIEELWVKRAKLASK